MPGAASFLLHGLWLEVPGATRQRTQPMHAGQRARVATAGRAALEHDQPHFVGGDVLGHPPVEQVVAQLAVADAKLELCKGWGQVRVGCGCGWGAVCIRYGAIPRAAPDASTRQLRACRTLCMRPTTQQQLPSHSGAPRRPGPPSRSQRAAALPTQAGHPGRARRPTQAGHPGPPYP